MLVCSLLCCGAVFASEKGLPTAAPEALGFSTAQLGHIGATMQQYVDDENLPGFLTVVARDGKIVHFETVGMRDRENQKPVHPDTIFRIYSMSKPITSVAAMMLLEEGHFALDTPISEFLPEFKDMQVYTPEQTETFSAQNQITVKHLLMHTAGFTYGWGNKPVDERYRELKVMEKGSTLADMARKLSDIPLVHEPGQKWTYGVSTDLLGYLVQVVSGMPFEEFLQTRIFGPLGMADTAFAVPSEKVDRFAALYRAKKEGPPELRPDRRISDDEIRFFPSGGGGLVSTAADYMRFSQMLLNGGELEGVRILLPETVETMRYPHHDGWFGLGFSIVPDKTQKSEKDEKDDEKDEKSDKDDEQAKDDDEKDDDGDAAEKKTPESPGSFSWGGAAATTFWIDPEKRVIGLLMTQILNNRYPFQRDFKRLTYQALTE